MARPSKQERRIKKPSSFASKVNDGNDGRKPNRRNGKDRPRKDGKPRPDDNPTDAQNPDDRPTDAPNPDNKPTDAQNPDNRPMARPKKMLPSTKKGRIRWPGFFGPTMNDGNGGRRPKGRNGKDKLRPENKPPGFPRPDDKPTDAP